MLPKPSDDELLIAFVDENPFIAMNDYRRRTGMWYDVVATDRLYDFFAREWASRRPDR